MIRSASPEMINILHRGDGFCFGETAGEVCLLRNGISYGMSDYPFEPCLYIKSSDGLYVTIRHSFTVAELCEAVRKGGTIRMITGDEYDVRGIFRLILKAIDLGREFVDIGYVEGHCFMEVLKRLGAVSPETAVDLREAGMANPNVMNPLLHSKKVGRTADARFYLRKAGEKDAGEADEDSGRFFRVISDRPEAVFRLARISEQE